MQRCLRSGSEIRPRVGGCSAGCARNPGNEQRPGEDCTSFFFLKQYLVYSLTQIQEGSHACIHFLHLQSHFVSFLLFLLTVCFLIRFTISRHRQHFSVLSLYTCTVIKYGFVGLSHGSKISRGPKNVYVSVKKQKLKKNK